MKPSVTRCALAGLAAVLSISVSACSTSSTSSSGASGGSSTGEAKKALSAAYTGVTGKPPTEATKPKAGVSLWVVSCGQQVPSCSTPVASVVEAAKKVGWTAKVCDGQLNPAGWGNCIRQATSAKADVVVPIGIDCASVQAPMKKAAASGVKLIGGGASDCDATGGKSVMDSERLQLPDTSIEQYWNLAGKMQADWLIGKTNGKAKVLLTKFTDPVWGPWLAAGFEAELKKCSGCSVVKTLDLANNDFVSNTAAQKFSSALLQATDANAVSVAVGGWMQAGLDQAIKSSGKAGKLAVATGFGDASSMDLIRSSSYTLGTLGYASPWGAYGSVDTAIRVLNGEKPQVEGDGFQMVDKTKNLPAKGDYQGTVDYKSAYLKLWGVS